MRIRPKARGAPAPRTHVAWAPAARILSLAAGMIAAAAALYLVAGRASAPAPPVHIPVWMLAGAFAITERFVVHLQFRGDSHAMNFSEIPLLVGIFTVDPLTLIVARCVGSVLSLVLWRRQWWLKVVFNTAKFALETAIALTVMHATGAIGHPGPSAWPGAFLGIMAMDAVSAVLVTLAIIVHEGSPRGHQLMPALWIPSAAGVANTCLGLVLAGVLWYAPYLAWLLGGIGVVLYLGYRGYASLEQRYANLKSLYQFTSAVGSSPTLPLVLEAVLAEARELLRATTAEITIASDDREHGPVRFVVEPGNGLTHAPAEDAAHDRVLRRVLAGESVLIPETTRDQLERWYLEGKGVDDFMAVPLRSEGAVIGALGVGGRLGSVRTFDEEDLKLFATLANHASVSLANAKLMERLRREALDKEYQAQHDALTGLPNRHLFTTRLQAAIESGPASPIAVMLLDLDGFKEINDTLGHHTGDVLLKHIAARLRKLGSRRASVARIGGDEFALYLEVSSTDDAVRTGRGILHAMEEPFFLEETSLGVGGSLGIAIFPEHGAEPEQLLQRADVAMYTAKRSGGGIDVYDSERDHRSPRRLALASELRRAIERRELDVHYQPKADIRTGRVQGAEALVRWRHPQFGFLPPDEFVPAAEHTGLIRGLTLFVLERALAECRAWNDGGRRLGVAVNLSARSLLDTELADDVERALVAAGVEPSLLTLEITETSIMADPARCEAVLNRLSAMGVQLAVDDFGTGYSSLSYLKRLPVDEVKIDRSFVLSMGTDENDAAIVRSIVDLGANLGLRVVAEGIEDGTSWLRLREMGCNVAQGYWLARPQSAANFSRWLAEYEGTASHPVAQYVAGVSLLKAAR